MRADWSCRGRGGCAHWRFMTSPWHYDPSNVMTLGILSRANMEVMAKMKRWGWFLIPHTVILQRVHRNVIRTWVFLIYAGTFMQQNIVSAFHPVWIGAAVKSDSHVRYMKSNQWNNLIWVHVEWSGDFLNLYIYSQRNGSVVHLAKLYSGAWSQWHHPYTVSKAEFELARIGQSTFFQVRTMAPD